MNNEFQSTITYFKEPGRKNTIRTLELSLEKARSLEISTVLVASTTGYTGSHAVEVLRELQNIIVVSHVCGYVEPNVQELTNENRVKIERAGAKILTAQHTMGGLNRAVRYFVKTYQLDEIIANSLRLFGQGMKVVLEISMMATDAGLIMAGEPVIAIGGTHRGADFAAVINPANSFRFFDLKLLEFICLPSMDHPKFKVL